MAYPRVGKIFELTLDGDDHRNDPLAMVATDGYVSSGWKFKGKKVLGKQTRRFKLVLVGRCPYLDEVIKKLKPYGQVPEGQWRQAFKAKYPKPAGRGSVGVADPSWVDSLGLVNFPYVDSYGYSHFTWDSYSFNEYWRWLVAVSE